MHGSTPDPGKDTSSPAGGSDRSNDFFSELKRRKVYRVGAAYLAVTFAVLEGADMIFPTLGLGPRVFNVLVLVILLGFPLSIALAWTFDVTAEGVRRTSPLRPGHDPAPAGHSPRLLSASR